MAVGTSERLKRTVSLFGGTSWWRNVLSICHSSSSSGGGAIQDIIHPVHHPPLCHCLQTVQFLPHQIYWHCQPWCRLPQHITAKNSAPATADFLQPVAHWRISVSSQELSAYVWPVQGLFLRFGVHHLCFFFPMNDNSWLTGSMGDNYRASSGYQQLKINLLLHCQYCREVELKLGVLRARFVKVDPVMSLWRWQFCNLLQCGFHIQN